ncbi:MAG: DNA gyrase subunit A [Minisyncoccia bacterium]
MPKGKPEEPKVPEIIPERVGVLDREIVHEMRDSYLSYAMSVITSRALPDIRDGLKPVHRRILYAMYGMGLFPTAKTRKSAAVVGEVLGKYHPHGDIAVYDAMVKLAQDFSIRYPLVLGQGNFGSLDGDSAAASRYTEAKMSRIGAALLDDIQKDTVNFNPNYENTTTEPGVLPAAVPNLLLNGTMGIAVGMATDIPPHNLREVIAAIDHLVENPKATNDDLLQFVKGPDFPVGAIAFNQQDITHAYSTGRGGVVVRGDAEILEEKKGGFQIIITSLPYRVNKATLIEKIADLVHEKRLEGIKGLRDESTKDIRIVVDIRPSAHPQSVLNFLYKHTQLEETYHYNMVALIDGVPQTVSLKVMLECFILHRKDVVIKRTKFDLAKAEAREHILIGLKKALDHIDEIIKLIKKSKDVPTAHAELIKQFKFSALQATAILEMRLQRLANLERQKIEDELAELQKLIAELKALLASEKKLLALIMKELKEIGDKYGDDRRTKIVKRAAQSFSMEDLIADEENVLVLSRGGYVKRTSPSEYRVQKRGGVGVIDLDTKEEDVVTNLVTASTHNDMLFFSDLGKAYQIKMYEVPEGKRATRGKSVMNIMALGQDEKVTSILPMPADVKKTQGLGLFMITKDGTVKKTEAAQFNDVRRNGLNAIALEKGDKLVGAEFVSKGDEITVVTAFGQSIRFEEADVRAMGRGAAGVRGIKLDKGDFVVGMGIIRKGKKMALFVVSATGYGKKTELDEYKTQSRGGSGIKTMAITDKTKQIIAAAVVELTGGEFVAVSEKGQIIRSTLDEVPTLSRATQGVRLMKLRDGDKIASVSFVEGVVDEK